MANTNLRVRELCKESGITIKELAEERMKTNYTSFLQALTRNVFSIPKLEEIADALGVTIPELFDAFYTQESDSADRNGKKTRQTQPDIIGVCPKCGAKLRVSISEEL